MNSAVLLAGIRDANYHRGGIRCLEVLCLQKAQFSQLRAEVEELCRKEKGSNVGHPSHITSWTRPRGQVLQFSLLNVSGRYDDFTSDHKLSCLSKQFRGGAAYPVLANFVSLFPHAINFRVNLMGPRSLLSPHEEHAVIRTSTGSVGVRARFHLPIVTNPHAELMLDGWVYHLSAGSIYFVNHGCVHSASNNAQTVRIHLVWDMLITREAFRFIFEEPGPIAPLQRISEEQQVLAPVRTERVGAYLRLPPTVSWDEAKKIEWCDVQ
jgi:hypothetical protein